MFSCRANNIKLSYVCIIIMFMVIIISIFYLLSPPIFVY
nr:MAG TPA: hypothetical protein [Caudoviricetes sp.]